MFKKQCVMKDGHLYCKSSGKWKKISKESIRVRTSKPFKVTESFKKIRTNVC